MLIYIGSLLIQCFVYHIDIVQSGQIQNHNQDEASTSRSQEEETPKLFENPFAINNEITGSNESITCARDEAQPTQDHVVLLDCKGCVNDNVESSSSSSSEVTTFDAAKNEAFRNSVRKVLTCLAFPRNEGSVARENTDATPRDLPDLLASVSSPTNDIPTKMQVLANIARIVMLALSGVYKITLPSFRNN